jgi:hypothetical protein
VLQHSEPSTFTRQGRRASEACLAFAFPKLAAFANLLREQATIVRPGSGDCKKRKLKFWQFLRGVVSSSIMSSAPIV